MVCIAQEQTTIVLTNGGKFVTDNALSERPQWPSRLYTRARIMSYIYIYNLLYCNHSDANGGN